MNSPLFLERNLVAARSLIAIPKVSYCNFCFEHQPEDGDATVASDEKSFLKLFRVMNDHLSHAFKFL